MQGAGFRVQGSGFRVQGSGCARCGWQFAVCASCFEVWGSGDTTPCKVTPVILHGVASPDYGFVSPEGAKVATHSSRIGLATFSPLTGPQRFPTAGPHVITSYTGSRNGGSIGGCSNANLDDGQGGEHHQPSTRKIAELQCCPTECTK